MIGLPPSGGGNTLSDDAGFGDVRHHPRHRRACSGPESTPGAGVVRGREIRKRLYDRGALDRLADGWTAP